ncbi:MAG: hypothetical protein EPO28_05820, partial [Saprospiraceae bacterium]
MNRKLLPSILFLALCIQTAHCTILYANANVQGGNQDGTSWTDAFPLLQSAIIAAQYGDTVWVAQGTYLPTTGTNRNISFTLKNGVRMFGGFTGVETALGERDWEANETILSGDIGMPGDSTDNSFTVVYSSFADSTTVLDGFVVTGGNADSQVMFEPSNGRTKSGGGLYLTGSSTTEDSRPFIINCKFSGNHAISNGGAVFMKSTSGGAVSLSLINCQFENNSSGNGGAIYLSGTSVTHDVFINECTFLNNTAQGEGGGIYFQNDYGNRNLIIQDCAFKYNVANLEGGAISYGNYNQFSKLILAGCTFDNNMLVGTGDSFAIWNLNWIFSDGLYIEKCYFLNHQGLVVTIFYSALVTLANSKFIGNHYCVSSNNASLKLINCLFSKSTSAYGQSGNSDTKVVNCAFYSNKNSDGGVINTGYGSPSILFVNTLFWKNGLSSNTKLVDHEGFGSTMNLTFSHTLVDLPDCASISNGPVTCGPGMLYLQDPLFADTAASDFTLLPCSPAINAGDNAIVDSLGILTDLAGNPRILGGTVDMGAYEAPALSVDTSFIALPSCGGAANGAVQFQLAHGCEPYSYAWTSGTASGTGTSGLPPGNYAFTITDALGKTVEAQVEIPEAPAVTASTTGLPYDCATGSGGSASATPTGGTAPFSFLWSTGDTTFAILEKPAGIYAVTVTDANGCTLTDTVQVEITGHLTLSINVTPTHCSDSDDGTAAITPLNGTAPFGWLWQDGQTDSLLTGLGGG